MSRLAKVFGYSFLFLFSFVFFTYIVFPYEVLKEMVAKEASELSGMDIRIGELEPKFFSLGFDLENVVLKGQGQAKDVKFDSIEASVGVFPLLIGSVSPYLEARVGEKDYLKLEASLGLIDLVQQNFIPSSIRMESAKFPAGTFVNFILKWQAKSMEQSLTMEPVFKAMLPPLLNDIEFYTELDSEVDLDLNTSNLEKSSGKISLDFKKALLTVTDPGLGIPKQTFSKALIKANMENGKLIIDPSAGFISNDLSFAYSGDITLKGRLERSTLDIKAKVNLSGPLKEQFGVVLNVVGAQKEDEVSLEVSGTVGSPDIKTF